MEITKDYHWKHGDPTEIGWYVVSFGWDSREGNFIDTVFWNGYWDWESYKAEITAYMGSFDNKEAAKRQADLLT